jgi:hypothetical protein
VSLPYRYLNGVAFPNLRVTNRGILKSGSGVLRPFRFSSGGTGSCVDVISDSGFRGSKLKSIAIPSSVIAFGERSFYECESLESVTFESASRLE